MSEERRQKRNNLLYYLRVVDRHSGQLLGNLVDITTDGFMLVSEHPIELEQTLALRMTLPDVLRGQTQISFAAQSLWCRPDVNPDLYDTGFRFMEVSEQSLLIIGDLIAGYFMDNEPKDATRGIL